MSVSSSEQMESEMEELHFQCACCGWWLDVPLSFAGVTAPCPECGEDTTAPCSVTSCAVEKTGPCDPNLVCENHREEPEEGEKTEDGPTAELEYEENLPVGIPLVLTRKKSRRRIVPTEVAKKRADLTIYEDDLSDEEAPKDTAAWDGFISWGAMLFFLGTVTCAGAVLTFGAKEKAPPAAVAVPDNLTELAEKQKLRMEERKAESMMLAISAAQDFLRADTSKGKLPLRFLSPGTHAAEIKQQNTPPDVLASLQATNCRRVPGTENFVTTIETTTGGPVVVVEESGEGKFIHGDALRQQSDQTLQTFLKTQSGEPKTFYVQVKPNTGYFMLDELEQWPKLDVESAFRTSENKRFIAFAKPGTEPAQHLEKRKNVTGFTPAVLELRWSKTPNGHSFIEIVKVIPNSWAKF